MLLVIAANKRLHVCHLDVKGAYLHSKLEEEIFLDQPPGFQKPGEESKVLRLRKRIYGLKQSARTWNKKATETLAQIGFQPGKADPCLYTKKEKGNVISYVLLYADDLLVAGGSADITIKRSVKIYKDISVLKISEMLKIISASILNVKKMDHFYSTRKGKLSKS